MFSLYVRLEIGPYSYEHFGSLASKLTFFDNKNNESGLFGIILAVRVGG